MDPFIIAVPDADLADLGRRLDATLLPEQSPGPDWSAGIPRAVLAGLLDRWRHGYNWREVEARLNTHEQHRVTLDGCDIHFARLGSGRSGALPIVLTHGWPYTFAQMLPLAEVLSAEREVVVPSLPGFAFSGVLPEPFSARAVAARWNTLLTEHLGYEHYLTYGEDVGAGVSDWLASTHAAAVGIVAAHASFAGRSRPGVTLSDEERSFLASVNQPAETGYAHQQGTRPDTLAAALTDSPSGLLAWIAEKLAAWSDGHRLDALDRDDVLTTAALFWFTRSIGTSFRSYSEPPADDELHPIITVPASIVVQRHESAYPRTLAEKSYADIRSFQRLKHGGHFTAWEAPDAVAAAIRELEAQIR